MGGLLVVSNREEVRNAHYFKNPEALDSFLNAFPEHSALLFAFWSWVVPPWRLQTRKCWGLHTGPLLEGRGRGGDPIGNLKKLGVSWTTLCAFEMDEGIDTGRVKLALPLYIGGEEPIIVKKIDSLLPDIKDYLTAHQPEIPAFFKRSDAK